MLPGTLPQYGHQLWPSAANYNNLIGHEGQCCGSFPCQEELGRRRWGVRIFPAVNVALKHENRSKARQWEKLAAEFCLVVWSYNKNTFGIFQDRIFFFLITFLVNLCVLFA